MILFIVIVVAWIVGLAFFVSQLNSEPRRIRRRRGESTADTNSRHFRELEASYLSMGLSPKAATAAGNERDADGTQTTQPSRGGALSCGLELLRVGRWRRSVAMDGRLSILSRI